MEQDTATVILGIAINVICTGAYYMAPALIYRFLIYKDRLPRSLAKKVCIISGIVLYLILFVIYVATKRDGIPNMKAAFFYTVIAYFIVRAEKEKNRSQAEITEQIDCDKEE